MLEKTATEQSWRSVQEIHENLTYVINIFQKTWDGKLGNLEQGIKMFPTTWTLQTKNAQTIRTRTDRLSRKMSSAVSPVTWRYFNKSKKFREDQRFDQINDSGQYLWIANFMGNQSEYKKPKVDKFPAERSETYAIFKKQVR